FVNNLHADLHPEGIWLNQMMALEDMLLANAVDNVCHEHVAYWDHKSMADLLTTHGLGIKDRSWNKVNGGSERLIIGHGPHTYGGGPEFDRWSWTMFSGRIMAAKYRCLEFLLRAKNASKTVLGYGASTKGNTLLQYYGIDTDLLPAIAERNPDKVGKVTAGSHIPIVSEETMRAMKPDYLLVLPWAFLDNFLER